MLPPMMSVFRLTIRQAAAGGSPPARPAAPPALPTWMRAAPRYDGCPATGAACSHCIRVHWRALAYGHGHAAWSMQRMLAHPLRQHPLTRCGQAIPGHALPLPATCLHSLDPPLTQVKGIYNSGSFAGCLCNPQVGGAGCISQQLCMTGEVSHCSPHLRESFKPNQWLLPLPCIGPRRSGTCTGHCSQCECIGAPLRSQ